MSEGVGRIGEDNIWGRARDGAEESGNKESYVSGYVSSQIV